jgi:hypothetical protein
MKITNFSSYIFWSYSSDADLPDNLIARQVILYGDLKDIYKLSELINRDVIAMVNTELCKENKYSKRCNLVQKLILEP